MTTVGQLVRLGMLRGPGGPAESLSDLTLEWLTFPQAAPAGTVISPIGSKTSGSTLTISPNDGRVVFNGAQTHLLVGLSASTPDEDVVYTITETKAGSPNSPKANLFTIRCVATPTIPLVAPSAAWDGTPGSGFVVLPTNPERTTAQCMLRRLFVQYTTFDGNTVIGWDAAAKGGVSHLEVDFEGAVVTVNAPSWHTYTTANGGTAKQYGYHVELDVAAWLAINPNAAGAIISARAVAVDGSILDRVELTTIHARANRYDLQATVVPSLATSGTRFQTILAALQYCKVNNYVRPHIQLMESGDYTCDQIATQHFPGTTWATFTCKSGEVAKLVRTPSGGNFRPKYDGLCFRGENIVIETDRCGITVETNGNGLLWFDGVYITMSNGRNSLIYNSVPLSYWLSSGNQNKEYYFTDCVANDLYEAYSYATLVRNCVASKISCDVQNNNKFVHGLVCHDVNNQGLANHVPAMHVTYTGAGSATLEKSSVTSTTGTITIKIGGVTQGTPLTVYDVPTRINTPGTAAGHYLVSDVVAYINGLGVSGLSATLISDARVAVNLTSGLSVSAPISPTDIKVGGAGFTFSCCFDVHADIAQWFGVQNNIIVRFMSSHTVLGVQTLFLDKDAGSNFSDIYFGQIWAAIETLGAVDYHMNAPHSHVVTDRITIAGAGGLRTDWPDAPRKYNPDAYCSLTNSYFRTLMWYATVDTDLTIDANHILTGTTPSNATNTTTGSTVADLFADFANHDFTPKAGSALIRSDRVVGALLADGAWNLG